MRNSITHLEDTPQLYKLVNEVIENTTISSDRMFFDYNFNHIIGESDLVKNDKDDLIVYAKRKNRNIYTSFNKTKSAQPSSIIAVLFERKNDGTYGLEKEESPFYLAFLPLLL